MGTAYADENTGYFTGKAQIKKARALLKESGYDGTPIVLMRPTDLSVIAKIPLVAEQQLKQVGFNVKLEQMDWPLCGTSPKKTQSARAVGTSS